MIYDVIEKFNGSVFYPLVSNCIASLHGNLDLISRGLINYIQIQNLDKSQIEDLLSQLTLNEKYRVGFIDNPAKTPLIDQLQFISIVNDDKLIVNIDEISSLILQRNFDVISQLNQAARILTITSYEFIKQLKDESPIWQFFRHIRNASAHRGKFSFNTNEPTKEAKWQNIEITKELDGADLFISSENKGLIYAGDVLLLLLDIEEQYPNIKSISFN